MIIDFHTHIFPDKIAKKTIQSLAKNTHTKPFTDGTTTELAASMKKSGIEYSVNLPVITRADQVEKINTSMIQNREDYLKKGIINFGGMHSSYANYRKELHRLKENGIPGIKMHPAYMDAMIDDIRMLQILDAASEENMIVIVHAGIDPSVSSKNYCPVSGIINAIEKVHPTKFVLAHMGGLYAWDEVKKDLAGAPVWFDTAFSIGPVTPNPESDQAPFKSENLSENAFEELVRAHGIDRILFGTDSPWSDQEDYVAKIKNMSFSDSEKEKIFYKNALSLLNAKDRCPKA